ncbi:MAG: hypothetical protein JWQ87_160 [Candidatus Sulfotelmatobacter sp.]|nr:hypothetical protein [Candidatus Sulfotelmatobacter sp.]
MPEKRLVKALVSVRKNWTKNMGLGDLFQSTGTANQMAEFHVIPVSRYDVSDHSFVEIEWYPKVLVDKWARVFIPKDQVVAVVILESSDDLGKIGYKV